MNLIKIPSIGTAIEPEDHAQNIEQLLTDIWHNQATIIKWLSKIAENTKQAKIEDGEI